MTPGSVNVVTPLHYIYTFLSTFIPQMFTRIAPQDYLNLGYPGMIMFANATPPGNSEFEKKKARYAFRLQPAEVSLKANGSGEILKEKIIVKTPKNISEVY